jgi:hypothetical protein
MPQIRNPTTAASEAARAFAEALPKVSLTTCAVEPPRSRWSIRCSANVSVFAPAAWSSPTTASTTGTIDRNE